MKLKVVIGLWIFFGSLLKSGAMGQCPFSDCNDHGLCEPYKTACTCDTPWVGSECQYEWVNTTTSTITNPAPANSSFCFLYPGYEGDHQNRQRPQTLLCFSTGSPQGDSPCAVPVVVTAQFPSSEQEDNPFNQTVNVSPSTFLAPFVNGTTNLDGFTLSWSLTYNRAYIRLKLQNSVVTIDPDTSLATITSCFAVYPDHESVALELGWFTYTQPAPCQYCQYPTNQTITPTANVSVTLPPNASWVGQVNLQSTLAQMVVAFNQKPPEDLSLSYALGCASINEGAFLPQNYTPAVPALTEQAWQIFEPDSVPAGLANNGKFFLIFHSSSPNSTLRFSFQLILSYPQSLGTQTSYFNTIPDGRYGTAAFFSSLIPMNSTKRGLYQLQLTCSYRNTTSLVDPEPWVTIRGTPNSLPNSSDPILVYTPTAITLRSTTSLFLDSINSTFSFVSDALYSFRFDVPPESCLPPNQTQCAPSECQVRLKLLIPPEKSSPPHKSGGGLNYWLAVGLPVLVLLLATVITGIFCYYKSRKQQTYTPLEDPLPIVRSAAVSPSVEDRTRLLNEEKRIRASLTTNSDQKTRLEAQLERVLRELKELN